MKYMAYKLGLWRSGILAIVFFTYCSPGLKTAVPLPMNSAENRQSLVPPDRAKWTWTDRQNSIHTFSQTLNNLQKTMEEYGIMGLSIVLKQGTKWSQSPNCYAFELGIENQETNKPIDANTVFQADRLGQPIIAYMIMKLVTEEKFDLDRALYKYLPKSIPEDNPYHCLLEDPRYKLLTARNILSHQSGLATSGSSNKINILTFKTSPGKGFLYLDEPYGFLQFVLEQKFGRSFNELANLLVFKPFGMSRTSFTREPRFEGHIVGEVSAKSDFQSDLYSTYGAFFTNGSDYTRFIWTVRLENPGLSYETQMSYIVWPTVTIKSSSIVESSSSYDRSDVPRKLSWSLGWGMYQIPRVLLGTCSFIGQRSQRLESYATVYECDKSTAITVFVANSTQSAITGLILRELLGRMETPLKWLCF
ncbi:MAG: class C beta-lactamase-related serine hydrolase [Syntrophobacterales bacterium]|nr:MAG: class C beta-lactamase-related serine hydrolase [Syntrophobacterales bacterium]